MACSSRQASLKQWRSRYPEGSGFFFLRVVDQAYLTLVSEQRGLVLDQLVYRIYSCEDAVLLIADPLVGEDG